MSTLPQLRGQVQQEDESRWTSRRTLELPDEELGEVAGEDELPEGSSRSRNGEGSTVLCEERWSRQLCCTSATISASKSRRKGWKKTQHRRRTLGEQALVNKTGDDVRVLEVVVVVRAEDVCRDGGGEVATELLVVSAVKR